MANLIEHRVDVAEERLDDHEVRVRSLEAWRAWLLGGLGLLVVEVPFALWVATRATGA
jgi:hypothetical protein